MPVPVAAYLGAAGISALGGILGGLLGKSKPPTPPAPMAEIEQAALQAPQTAPRQYVPSQPAPAGGGQMDPAVLERLMQMFAQGKGRGA